MTTAPRTLFEKLWDHHVVVPETEEAPAILYVDLHLVHEVTSPQAFAMLRETGSGVRRPERTVATMDHSTPTLPALLYEGLATSDSPTARQLRTLEDNCAHFGIELHGISSPHRGIIHVIGPELGLTQPGSTIVCGDSHTSTHGAFGALAFGIGTTEVGHVLATQCLLQRQPRTLAIQVAGRLGPGVTAKDLILAIIGHIGVAGGTGHVIEYRGTGIEGLTMEERMTVCNMSIEAGARAGMIAPDEHTLQYLADRPMSPRGEAWDEAAERWRALPSDPGAHYDKIVEIDAGAVEPMITFGTNPGMVIPIGGEIPDDADDPALRKALEYMDLAPGETLQGRSVDVVFIGSCSNARLSDLRQAARVMAGRRIASHVTALVVPGSQEVKRQAEAEGLDRIFLAAGAEWRESGCSMCIAMNGDRVEPGRYAVSTSNRNFEGRQGSRARTLLASPPTAAAAAVTGKITDPRELLH